MLSIMRQGLPHSLARRSWWWIFGLLIAMPALALSLLGLGSFRADEIERQQRLRDQQAQVRRLADVALATALDREVTDARGRSRWSPARGPDGLVNLSALHFEIDTRNVVSFPSERVYVAGIGAESPAKASLELSNATLALVAAAQAADAQGRTPDAVRLYGRLRAIPELRVWADLQLLVLRSHAGLAAVLSSIAKRGLASSDALSPSGIPIAIVASSLSEDVPLPARQHFSSLLEQALQELRRGRWWLNLPQRSVYDAELRRWLMEGGSGGINLGPDERLSAIGDTAALIARSFDESQRVPPRAQVVRTGRERTLLVWTRPTQASMPWSGVAIRPERAETLFAAAIAPLLKDQPFRAALRDQYSVLWGNVSLNANPDNLHPLQSIPGWTLAFADIQRPFATSSHQLLNYARVVFPVVVLACGLVMTAWIRRRELALTELQSTFVAAVTHEFKSPITSIRLLMERITSGRIAAGDSQARYYGAIGAETDRLEGLVNRLLEAQKLQCGQKTYAFRPTVIEAVLRDALDRMRPQAEARRIELDLRIAPGIPTLALDSDSVADAVRNLLDNAIKYSPDSTCVDVALDLSEGHVELTVSDQGIGVDPADAQRIFEPFYRSRRGDGANVHGTGLGLSLVKATAVAHAGSVTVSSDGQRGSRFTMAFPLRHNALGTKSAAVDLVLPDDATDQHYIGMTRR